MNSSDRDGLTGVLVAGEDECGKAVHCITSHAPETVGWLILHADGIFVVRDQHAKEKPKCAARDDRRE